MADDEGGGTAAEQKPPEAGGMPKVTLVGFHDGKVSVHYSEPNGRYRREVALDNAEDTPHDEFIEAFEVMTPLALDILRLKGVKSWQTAKVTKVHVSEIKGGRRQYILTVYQPLEHGGVALNTPARTERLEPTEVAAGFASDELRNAVLRICAAALAYERGHRIQGELFPTENPLTGAPMEDASIAGEIGPRSRKAAAQRAAAKVNKKGKKGGKGGSKVSTIHGSKRR